jgi:hypothetical protein
MANGKDSLWLCRQKKEKPVAQLWSDGLLKK